MLRHGKYKRQQILAEGVSTQKAVAKAEKQEETKEVKKNEEEVKADRQKLFKAWASSTWR